MTDAGRGEAAMAGDAEQLKAIAHTLACWNCQGGGVEIYQDLSEYTCHVCHGWGTPNKNYSMSVVREAARRLLDLGVRADRSRDRDTHRIECFECDATVLVYVDEPVLDLSAMEPGWRFDSDEGWTCPEHVRRA